MKSTLKSWLLAIALFLAGTFGIISSSGSIVCGAKTGDVVYIIAGIVNFAIVGYACYKFGKQYLGS